MDSEKSIPNPLIETSQGQAIFDRQVEVLREARFENITCLADYHIEKMIHAHSDVEYINDPEGMDDDPIETLSRHKNIIEGGTLISSGEVLFSNQAVDKLTQSDADVTVAAAYFSSDTAALEAARTLDSSDLVSMNDTLSATTGTETLPDARLLGLVYVSPEQTDAVKSVLSVSDEYPNSIPEFVLALSNRGLNVEVVKLEDEVQRFDEEYALAQFLLGTKAETLDRLSGLVDESTILDQVVFDVSEWTTDAASVIERIRRQFPEGPIVVRSSSMIEDGWESSEAGAFHSELGVDPKHNEQLRTAIESVVDCFSESGKGTEFDQVLVQPQVEDVEASGVAFTRDLDSGGPYTVINYDDTSGETDTVTAGQKTGGKTVYIHEETETTDHLEGVVDEIHTAVTELRELLNNPSLDIEFAVNDGEVIILQVRPLAVHTGEDRFDVKDVNSEIETTVQAVEELDGSRPLLHGEKTVLGVMPDWNPAEMIGDDPDTLAISLYKRLITDDIWAQARAESGYRDVRPSQLMVTLAGRPYIDTQVDFNSFLPASLPEPLSEKLVNHYLDRLEANPEFHDTIEFTVAFTSLDFDFESRRQQLVSAGFTDDEIETVRRHLRLLTDSIVRGQRGPIDRQRQRLLELGNRRTQLLAERPSSWSATVRCVSRLLEDTRQRGTLPFAILARYAFISKSFLGSLVSRGVMTDDQRSRFLEGIHTIAHRIADDTEQLRDGQLSPETFLREYGHLRPGTYGIRSPRYDVEPAEYFDLPTGVPDIDPLEMDHQRLPAIEDWEPTVDAQTREVFKEIKQDVESLIAEEGFQFTAEELYQFIVQSIPLRELGKFAFTRNLSAALQLLRWGATEYLEIDPDELAHLPVDRILEAGTENESPVISREFEQAINHNQKRGEIQRRVQLPPILTEPQSVRTFDIAAEQPNYITSQNVTAETVQIDEIENRDQIDGRIALIPSADPGYDWIFGADLAGIVTKYGGVASHMAIRAAEFGIPAAIGCGTVEYERVLQADVIEFDCDAGRIKVIQ